MRPVSLVGIALAAAFTLGAVAARAQGNDRSAPTGGRTALMGNAGVALGRDGAAPFLNPATIVRIDDQNLAFSVNFYTFEVTHISGWHQPGAVDAARFGKVALQDTGISSSGFRAIPSTLCLFVTVAGIVANEQAADDAGHRRGRQKLAFCLGSLESQDVSLPALSFRGAIPAGTTTQVQSIARSWNRFHIGPTYSVAITDELAAGLSLHGVYTSDSFVVDGSSISSAVGGGAIQSTLGAGGIGHSLDLTAILGATFRVDRFTLGASAQLPGLHVTGGYDATLHSEYAGQPGDVANLTSGSGSFSALPPVRLAFGVGAEWKKLTLELDGSFQFAASDALTTTMRVDSTSLANGGATPTSFDATYTIRSRPVWNTAVGGEYFVTPSFSVIGGVSTNLSTMPALSPTMTLGNLDQSRMHRASLSIGVGSYGGAGDILIGAQLGYGWGETMAVNPYVLPNDWAVVDTQTYSAMLVLAGATNLRAIRRAVERVENVVTTGKPEDAPRR